MFFNKYVIILIGDVMKNKKKVKTRKINKKRLFICIAFLIIAILGIALGIIFLRSNSDNEPTAKPVEKIDQMENYDYYLDENATEYYKELYNELKNILNEDEVNNEEYAKIVSKLFITDLFTLDNKLTSSDIGGFQFIYSDFKDDFIKIAKTTLYSSVESNIYGDRSQELPIVKNVVINDINESSFSYKDNSLNAYDVNITIEYEKDLDYPSEYKLVLIWNDKYLQIASAS